MKSPPLDKVGIFLLSHHADPAMRGQCVETPSTDLKVSATASARACSICCRKQAPADGKRHPAPASRTPKAAARIFVLYWELVGREKPETGVHGRARALVTAFPKDAAQAGVPGKLCAALVGLFNNQ